VTVVTPASPANYRNPILRAFPATASAFAETSCVSTVRPARSQCCQPNRRVFDELSPSH